MLLSKLKQVWICLKAGRVTLRYPFEASHTPDAFRGLPDIDPDKCIGCAGCANVCSPRAIVVTDIEQGWRRIDFFLERCTYCGRCEEVCPEGAVTMTQKFETATNVREDLHISFEMYMGSCARCGRCYNPAHPLDKLMATGFREQ